MTGTLNVVVLGAGPSACAAALPDQSGRQPPGQPYQGAAAATDNAVPLENSPISSQEEDIATY
ncbi:MAG: hypothetical protein M3Y28_00935 [Armatimonadota bacterium]|nr:hypothetical protein [Armatimonadota bacterium]